MMKKIILIMTLVCVCIFLTKAENNPEKEWDTQLSSAPLTTQQNKLSLLSRIHIGGNIGGGFSNNQTYFTIAPRVSYEVTKWFVPGILVTYQYSQWKSGANKLIDNTWGAGATVDLYPVKWIFGHAEYQHLWWNEKVKPSSLNIGASKGDDDYLLLGGGVRVPIGSKAYVYGSVLWDVLDKDHSLYNNPVYNVGFGVGL